MIKWRLQHGHAWARRNFNASGGVLPREPAGSPRGLLLGEFDVYLVGVGDDAVIHRQRLGGGDALDRPENGSQGVVLRTPLDDGPRLEAVPRPVERHLHGGPASHRTGVACITCMWGVHRQVCVPWHALGRRGDSQAGFNASGGRDAADPASHMT